MKYAKGIAAAVGTFCTAVVAVFADNVVSMDEWGNLVTALIVAGSTIIAVVRVENKDV